MSTQTIPYSNLIGTDTIDSFVGLVSVQPEGNYVLNFGDNHHKLDIDDEIQVVKFETPRKFYSPYAPDVVCIDVVGEMRTLNYQEPNPNVILFGYAKPHVTSGNTDAYGYNPMQCMFAEYNGVNYRVYGEIDWDTPTLPITPVDYVRTNLFAQSHTIQVGAFAGTTVHGDMVDNRFGDEVELQGDTPEDFDEYLDCGKGCSNYSEHYVNC